MNEMRWACSMHGEVNRLYSALEETPEEGRPLGRSWRRWKDNIKMDLQELGCGGMDWIELAQYRDRWRELVKAVMSLRVP